MTKTLIVPGLDGSPAPHWQDWWAATDAKALLVDLPNPSHPCAALWEIELAAMLLQHPNSILVGHSLGAVLIARVLSKFPQCKVRAALLVAPADTRGHDRIAHFGPVPDKPLHVRSTLVASRNDPWMRYDRTVQVAQAWGSELVDLGMAGHVNVASGFGPWPQGKALRDDLLLQIGFFIPSPQKHRRIAL